MKKILRVFTKPDCRSCDIVKRRLETISNENIVNIDIQYIDVDKFPVTARKYEIAHVPAMVLENDNGDIMWRRTGNITYYDLRENLEK